MLPIECVHITKADRYGPYYGDVREVELRLSLYHLVIISKADVVNSESLQAAEAKAVQQMKNDLMKTLYGDIAKELRAISDEPDMYAAQRRLAQLSHKILVFPTE